MSRSHWYHEMLSLRKHWEYTPSDLVCRIYGTEGREFESLSGALSLALQKRHFR
jgi:hypothetical protein